MMTDKKQKGIILIEKEWNTQGVRQFSARGLQEELVELRKYIHNILFYLREDSGLSIPELMYRTSILKWLTEEVDFEDAE